MRCSRLLILALASAAAALGCQGPIAPLSAQQGSTILIPISGFDYASTPIGYGAVKDDGTPLITDYQRGMLVYHLDSQSGPTLITRGTTALAAYPNSPEARSALPYSTPAQVFSIVDIPDTAPVGQHYLFLGRQFPGQTGDTPIPVSDQLSITILPKSIPGPNGSLVGTSTPFEILGAATGLVSPPFAATDAMLSATVPDPELRLTLSQSVWAADVHILYPVGVINVVDALEPAVSRVDHRASVWFQDNAQNGQLTLNAVATQQAFSALSVVFTLQDGATAVLDPSKVFAVVTQAWDQNGNVISGVGVTKQIF